MPRSTPTTLALPPFTGATRRLIVIFVSIFFIDAVLSLVLPSSIYSTLLRLLILQPALVARGELWQLGTYCFLPMGIFGTFVSMLTLWFIGSLLEDARGARWLYELFFTSAIAGATLASLISFTHLFGLRPESQALGQSAGIFGLLIAVAVLMGDLEFLLFFFIRIRAKYLVAIYILVDVAMLLKTANAFGALLSLSGGLCGYLFLRFSGRRGLTYGFTERYFALRNSYYRWKRRSAARKFEVYMGKQGRQVHFDKDGRYVDPDKDPTDKRWMN